MTSTSYEQPISDLLASNEHFDSLYPPYIQRLSAKHWTPINAATLSAGFLAEKPGTRILDIGSGVGKFCLIGAYKKPDSHFYGIEQRKKLVQISDKTKKKMALENTTFIHGNFTKLNLSEFDSFYFYNSFYENLVDDECHIDKSIDYSVRLYEYYTRNLYSMLEERPVGTRLVTYHSFREGVPQGYRLVKTMLNTLVQCWIKE